MQCSERHIANLMVSDGFFVLKLRVSSELPSCVARIADMNYQEIEVSNILDLNNLK